METSALGAEPDLTVNVCLCSPADELCITACVQEAPRDPKEVCPSSLASCDTTPIPAPGVGVPVTAVIRNLADTGIGCTNWTLFHSVIQSACGPSASSTTAPRGRLGGPSSVGTNGLCGGGRREISIGNVSLPNSYQAYAEIVQTEPFDDAETEKGNNVDFKCLAEAAPVDAVEMGISDATGTEADGALVFTVSLSEASASDVTFSYRTNDGTASAPEDYVAQGPAATLEIQAGATSAQIQVTVVDDSKDEPDETLVVLLSNAVNATLADAAAVGTIEDDDGPPALSIDDAGAVQEGGAGTSSVARFTVTLSEPSGFDVSVDYETRDGTATAAGEDYAAKSSPPSEMIPAGETSTEIEVQILGDETPEPNESFSVALLPTSAPAAIGDGIGLATILDDDSEPVPPAAEPELARIGPRSRAIAVDERLALRVEVTSEGVPQPGVEIGWSIASGADLGRLELATSLTNSSGRSRNRVESTGAGEIVVEARCAACRPGAKLARFILTAEDGPDPDDPSISFEVGADTSVEESVGQAPFQIACTGSAEACSSIEFNVTPTGGTASEGADCDTASDASSDFVLPEVSNFPPGQISVEYSITICDDTVEEDDEILTLSLRIGDREEGTLELEILDDDEPEDGPDDHEDDHPAIDPHVTMPTDTTRRLAEVNLGNVLSRMATLRRGGPTLSTELASLEIQGVKVPLDVLAHNGRAEEAEEFDIARLLSGEESGSGASADGERADSGGREENFGMFVTGIVAFGDRRPSPAIVERPRSGADLEQGALSAEEETTHGFDFQTDGLMVGMDYRFDKFVAGGAVSFSSTRSDLAEGAGRIDTDGLYLSSYLMLIPKLASTDNGNLFLDAVLSFGRNEFDHLRTERLEGGDAVATASAQFSGDQLSAYVGSGYERNFGAAVMSGHGSLSYIRGDVDGFEEAGDATARATVDAQKLESLLASVGVDLSYYFWTKSGVLAPGIRFAVRRELEDESPPITGLLRFPGRLLEDGPDEPVSVPFVVQPAPPDADYFNLGLSLLGSYEWGSFFVSYDQDLQRSDFNLEAFTAGVRIGF